jgi:hypothetical protein
LPPGSNRRFDAFPRQSGAMPGGIQHPWMTPAFADAIR